MTVAKIYSDAAKLLGWRWSAAHNGFIHGGHLRPNCDRNSWSSYHVAADEEDACFISGIETDREASDYVWEQHRYQAAKEIKIALSRQNAA